MKGKNVIRRHQGRRLRKLVAEGARARSDMDRTLAEEWFALEEELWRGGGLAVRAQSARREVATRSKRRRSLSRSLSNSSPDAVSSHSRSARMSRRPTSP